MEESWDNFAVTWRNRASLNARASPYFISPRVSRKNTRKFFRDTINIIFQRLQYLRYGILFRTECTLLRSHSRIYSVATMRAHLETGASLCGQIHGVYRYLYVRGLAFHNQFSKVTSTTTAWASRFCTLLSAPGPEVTFPLCAFKDSRCFSAPYTCTSGLHSSLARMFYSLFLLLCFDTSIGAFHYYCLFIVCKRKKHENKYQNDDRDDTTTADDFVTAFIKLRNNIF